MTTPQLRFPEFTDEWQNKPLSDLLIESKKRNDDKRFGKEDVFSVSGILGVVNQIEFQGRSFAGASLHDYHVVEPNDIVYTKSPLKSNPFGIVKFNPNKSGIVSTLYAVYKPKGDTSSKYLDYYFQLDDNVNKYLRPLVHKGAKNDMKISNSHVLDGYIFAPKGNEQQKITDFLATIDEKIENLDKKVKQLKQYKKDIMQKIFTQQIRFKDKNRNEYPPWQEKTFGELLDYEQPTKYTVHSTEYDDAHKTPVLTAGKTFILGYTNETDNIYEGIPVIIFDDFTTASQFVDFPFKVKSSAVKILRNRPGVNIKIAYELLQQIKYNAGDHKRHWIGEFQNFTVSVPGKDEQQKIADFLIIIDFKIETEASKLANTKSFKKALLQRMLA